MLLNTPTETELSWDVATGKDGSGDISLQERKANVPSASAWMFFLLVVFFFFFPNMKPQIKPIYLLHQPQIGSAVIFVFFNLFF